MKNFKIPIDNINLTQCESNSQAGQDLFVIAMMSGKKNGVFLEIGSGHLKQNNNTYLLEKKFNWEGYSIDLVDIHSSERFHHEVNQWWERFYNDVRDSDWPRTPKSLQDLPTTIQQELIDIHLYFQHYPKKLSWKQDRPLTKFIQHDALKLNYSFLPETIDYLQVDIEPPLDNLLVLEKIIKRTTCAVITFEHDFWKNNHETNYVRRQSRNFLKKHGYEMIVNDVTIEPGKGVGIQNQPIYFEDWYVHPDIVNFNIINSYKSITDNMFPKYYSDILFDV
jgi:hypothetical protein